MKTFVWLYDSWGIIGKIYPSSPQRVIVKLLRGATSISDGIFSNERSENWEPPTWVLKKAQGARFVSNWSFGQIILEQLSMTPPKNKSLTLL